MGWGDKQGRPDVHLDCDRRYDAMADSCALVLAAYERLWTAHVRLLLAMCEAVEDPGPTLPTPQQLRETIG